MEESKRVFLEKGQSIHLAIDTNGNGAQEFIVQSVIGEGGSSVCYDAIRVRDGLPGKLKEFYPIDAVAGSREWYYSLERCADGQLIPKGGTIRKFNEMCEDYLSTYATLNQVMVDNPQNQVLKNYIQNGEVLYGIATEKAATSIPSGRQFGATVYIWSPGIMGQGFDEYLMDVRKNPAQNTNFKLRDILSTVYTLADCIRALHAAGLMHLDIKPSNFLVPLDSKNGINTSSVSLFDIDTLYSAGSDIPRMAGTEGFRAPEVFKGKADHRSDIYSIGAMLFNALVILDDIPDGIYRADYYQDIDRMVKHSALIKHSTASTKLVSLIANIIKKCLARNPGDRYSSCTNLLDCLESAKDQAKINAGNPRVIGQNQKLAVVDVNEKGINSPSVVIQKMLYDHPLYEVLEPGQTDINVLVIGSGTYGQKFIDLCLQAGQMKGYDLQITAVSNTPNEDREAYLQFRPALSRFVNVNGSMDGDSRAYGTLNFISLNEACAYRGTEILQFERGKNKPANERLIADLFKEAVDNEKIYDYVFIALGSSTLNQEIAQLCKKETLYWGGSVRCPICYISELAKKKTRINRDAMLYSAHINEPITPQTINPVLEQMAFNADICWNSSLNIDVKASFDEFRKDKYRYDASLAMALSIPYKLFSIGIVLQNETKPFSQDQFPGFVLAKDALEAANEFSSEILAKKDSDEDAQKKFNTLVCLEHQRWVLNRVCEAWDVPRDEKGQFDLGRCVSEGTVKNEANLTHPCIVFSTEDTPLNTPLYKDNGHKEWDNPNIDPNLDELDHMSVELHQRFQERAAEIKAKNPLKCEDILAIEMLIAAADEPVHRGFKQFVFCLKNILNGVESYTRQYDHYRKCFVSELNRVSEQIRDDVIDRLKLIDGMFFPIKEANLYRNYKATDEILVERIPFILTYHFQETIALAFEDGKYQNGRNEAVFANVAAATLLSPENILYLYTYGADSKQGLLINKLSAVINYLGKRKAHSKVSLVVAIPPETGNTRRDKLKKALEKLKEDKQADLNASFVSYEIFDFETTEEAVSNFLRVIKDNNVSLFDGSTTLFDSLLDNVAFLNQLCNSRLPYFEFDWRHKKFTRHQNCEYLQYIHDNSSIRINDMFALMNAEDIKFNLPEFADDYDALWKIYTGKDVPGYKFDYSVGNWNDLCFLLEEYENAQMPLATIDLDKGPNPLSKEMVYVLPEYAYKTAKTIVDKLIEMKLVSGKSTVSGYTSENCKVELIANVRYEGAFNCLFARPEIFHSFYGIDILKHYSGKSVRFVYFNMKVENLNLESDGKRKEKFYYDILVRLEENHFIRNLTVTQEQPKTVSFEYISQRLKKLLTTAGEILEVYTYYQLLKTGYFDDVVCGYEFCWQDGGVKNELDVVAVKGFRSIIIECKAVQKLELNYYHKLHSIAEHFGIGAQKVLVGNIYSYRADDPVLGAANQMQQSRGKQLGIVTVSEEAKIVNIGQTLKNLMDK